MAKNLKKYLNTCEIPSVIYCSVPSLDVASVAAKYAKKNNVKFVIDIQDLWPEAFKMVFNKFRIAKILFFPMEKRAEYIYRAADHIIAVSQTYLNHAVKVNLKAKGNVIYLGTDLNKIDEILKEQNIEKPKTDEFIIGYIGTLGHSYDIKLVIDALKLIISKGYSEMKFLVMGDGPLIDEYINYATTSNINCIFTGRLPYDDMIRTLSKCDIAINPIKKDSAGSIINKVADYAAIGLPVINTQENQEYKELLNKYNAGLNSSSQSSKELAEKILILYNDSELLKTMSENSRKLAEENFNRSETYKKILHIIKGETND